MNGRVRQALLVSFLLVAATPMAGPAEAGGGCHSAGPEPAETVVGSDVEIQGNCFRPAVLAVDPGATVRFHNSDPVQHVVVGTRWVAAGRAAPGAGADDQIAPGATAESRFVHPGTYPYSCYLHPGMNGVILVGDAPAGATQVATVAKSSDASDLPPLALGVVAGLVLSAAGSSRRFRSLLLH